MDGFGHVWKGNPFSNAKPDPILTRYTTSCLENGPIFFVCFFLFVCFCFRKAMLFSLFRLNINDFGLFVFSLHQC